MTTETNKRTLAKTGSTMDRAALPLVTLAIPIVFESFFRILVSSIDTIMLSSYSQQAVAGVGLVSQYIFFLQILFNMICIGTSIVLAQYLGGKRIDECKQVAQASAVMVTGVGLFLTTAVILGTPTLLSFYEIEPQVRSFAATYFVIFGGFGALFTAFNMLQGTILRSYGYTREAMYVSFAANIINVVGNSISLYGFFGLPVFGVTGVAISSLISQIAACGILAAIIAKKKDVQFPLKGWSKVPQTIYRKILSIGVPTAGENLAYNVAQIVIMAMISTLGTWAMSAQVYTQTIVRFVFVAAMSIGNAVQIKTGYFVGAKEPEKAYRRLYRYVGFGILVSLAMITVINLFKIQIIGLFTDEPEIIRITAQVLLVAVYVEFGRAINLITIPGLKGAGDVKFPVFIGMLCMWGIGVLWAWILGIRLGMGLPGIWIAVGSDETIRGFIMLARWKSKRWMTKAIS